MKHVIFASVVLYAVIFAPFESHAWDKRGHQAICETAAFVVSGEPEAGFMKARAFDFGYYCNVPDFIWKKPKTYEFEKNQHFMDLEIFDAAFKKKPDAKKPYDMSRKEFETQFPEVPENAGRAFWRTKELNDSVTAITEQLRAMPAEKSKEKQALQEKWLVLLGVIGHYVGDLSQPLHTTENFDGQLTGQKGIHAFYEVDVVNELDAKFRLDVQTETAKRWPKFKKDNEKKSLPELLEQLTRISVKDVKALLDIDKKGKRDSARQVAGQYRKLIVKNMVDGSLTLAEIYRRQLGFKFDDNRFYFFAGEPEYIMPAEGGPKAPAEKK